MHCMMSNSTPRSMQWSLRPGMQTWRLRSLCGCLYFSYSCLQVRHVWTVSLRVQVARFHMEKALLQQQTEQAKSEVEAILASRSSQVQGAEVRAIICR